MSKINILRRILTRIRKVSTPTWREGTKLELWEMKCATEMCLDWMMGYVPTDIFDDFADRFENLILTTRKLKNV
jgi:hypothetical protein